MIPSQSLTRSRPVHRRFALWLSVVASLAFGALPAQADLWQTAKTLREGNVSIGGFGQLFVDPAEFMAVGQVTYGVAPNVQIEGRLGLGTLDPLVGVFGKYQFKPFPVGAFAIWGGLRTLAGIWAIEVAPIWSIGIERLDLYLAPLLTVPLEDGPSTGLGLVSGIAYPFEREWSFYGQVQLNLSNSPTALSAGVRYFF